MKNLFSVLFTVVLMFSLYSCSDDVVSPTEINVEENKCFEKAPIYMNDCESGNVIVSYDSVNFMVNFKDIPDNVSEVKIAVFVDSLVGEPHDEYFFVNNFIPTKGNSYSWCWETFYIYFYPNRKYYIYIQFNVGNNVGWVGKHNRPYSGGTLRWVEMDCK